MICFCLTVPTGQVLISRVVLVPWRPPTFGKQNEVIITYTIVLLEVPSNTTLMYEQEGNIFDKLHSYYKYKCFVVTATQVGNGPIYWLSHSQNSWRWYERNFSTSHRVLFMPLPSSGVCMLSANP